MNAAKRVDDLQIVFDAMVHLAQEHFLLPERGFEGLLYSLQLSDLPILL